MITLTLLWNHENQPYTTYVTPDRPVLIGRDPVCTVREVTPMVSARHVQVFHYEGHFYVRNLKPANPVALNQVVIERSTRLKPNDVLTFGGMTFRVQTIGERKVGVRCNNCEKVIDLSYANRECPICGHSLVNGTIIGFAEA